MSLIENSRDEVFILDDDADVCDALSIAFIRSDFRVTAFRDAAPFIAAARVRPPACVLLDVHMPGKSGLDVLKEIDAGSYRAPVLMMSGRGDIPTAVKAIRDGASGFIEKGIDPEIIVARVRETISDFHPDVSRNNRHGNGSESSQSFRGRDLLTPREHEVLSQITAAASNKVAAINLGISQRTIEVHRIHIMQKLGAKNAVDLIRIVLGKGNGA
jgi:two-component system, LuxR family, response regulator FixJ